MATGTIDCEITVLRFQSFGAQNQVDTLPEISWNKEEGRKMLRDRIEGIFRARVSEEDWILRTFLGVGVYLEKNNR